MQFPVEFKKTDWLIDFGLNSCAGLENPAQHSKPVSIILIYFFQHNGFHRFQNNTSVFEFFTGQQIDKIAFGEFKITFTVFKIVEYNDFICLIGA